MINPIRCLICGFLAGSIVGLGTLLAGKQSQYLSLFLTVTGIAGMAGATSTLTLFMNTKASKRLLIKGLKELKGNYEDIDKLVEIEILQEKIWRL